MIKVHVLHTGSVSVDRAIPFRHWNPFAKIGWFRSKKNRLHLPVSAYLIEHPKGLVLFDTGWNVDTREKVVNRKYFLPISYGMLPEGQAIHEQLARLGHAPSSLDYVFLSHLDGDHVGGLMHVKDAKHILVSELEWAAANQSKTHIRYNPKRWSGIDVQTFQYAKTGVGPFGESFDVFGDGTVQLVSTRGHSPGLSTMLVSSGDKFVAMIGDTGYAQESWKETTLPGLTVNKEEATKSLQWVRELSTRSGYLGIFATHDPEVEPCTVELC